MGNPWDFEHGVGSVNATDRQAMELRITKKFTFTALGIVGSHFCNFLDLKKIKDMVVYIKDQCLFSHQFGEL